MRCSSNHQLLGILLSDTSPKERVAMKSVTSTCSLLYVSVYETRSPAKSSSIESPGLRLIFAPTLLALVKILYCSEKWLYNGPQILDNGVRLSMRGGPTWEISEPTGQRN